MGSKFLSLSGLKECIDRQNAIEAKDLLENIFKFFDEILSKAEIEHALEILFHTQTGTIGFLNRTIKERKLFKDCNITIFDIWIKIIKNYATEANFDLYIQDILECCMKYIISTMVSAKEKEKAAIVLQDLFENKLVVNFDISELVNKLLDVFNIKTHTEIFLQQIFKLLGIISKDSPDAIIGTNAIRIRDSFIKTLEDILLNEETVKFHALTGAMCGLDLFLINFAPSRSDEEGICQRIYVCVKKLSDPPPDFKQKAVFRAAIDVFTHHYSLFAENIFKDFNHWHNVLLKWISAKVYEDRRKGIYAMHSFQTVIADEIFKHREANDPNILNILNKLTAKYRTILESSDSRPHETRIAIRGFGLLAGSCKALLPEKLDDLLSLVIQRTELISVAEDNELRDTLEHFPDYIQALSQIIRQITDKHIIQILSLNIQNIVVRLIKDFHYLSRAHTGLVVNSLSEAFYNLSAVDGNLLNEILQKIIFQGIIWTCSHKLVYDAKLDWETNIDWKDNITYKNYMPLWEGLLEETTISQFNKPLIAKIIFDHLMSTLFQILEKLNLQTKRRVFADDTGQDQEFHFCDPNIDLCPVKPKDFHIFFNMVDFYRDIFWSKYRRENFRKWANEFCSKMMEYFVKNPLVSGFLKLLEIGLHAADYLEHFNDTKTTMIQSNILLKETKLLEMELLYFLKNLINKCQQMSGELQISCLEVILKFPVKFYSEYIYDLIAVFEIAFDLGKSIIWLAKLAIICLEKISDYYQENISDMKRFYKQILPKLDTYLQSNRFLEDYKTEIIQNKNKKRIRRAKIQNISETELLEVQRQIFSFLGKLDPHNAAFLVSRDFKESLVKWDITQNIHLRLHLPDIKPEIYLDTIVPRICHLAITSSDRKTKIAACELVHAVILYLLGTKNHEGQIWKELCTRMLILGSDGDDTVQQLFKPLLVQTMHFMSKYENLERGVDVLLEVLMDGISNTSNCTVRDLAAECLREFVEWSIRQTTPAQLAVSSASIEIILKQLKLYSFDSNGAKRSGASLAFNNLYRKLREQESICSIFFIDLFYTFCVNFKLSEELSVVPVGTMNSDLEQVSQSLDHVVRVLKERNHIFNKSNPQRHIPHVFPNGTLEEIVLYLITESGSKLMNYRQKCFQMIESLAPAVVHIKSVSMFLQKLSYEKLLEICEGTPNGTGIRARPNLDFIRNFPISPHRQIYSWLEHFLSSLDCYCWLLTDKSNLKSQKLFENSIIFETISYYFKKILWSTMFEIIGEINSDLLSEPSSDTVLRISTEEMNKIESIKCVIVIRLMNFITKTLQTGCATKYPSDFWSNHKEIFFKFLSQIMYEPHYLNFDFKSIEFAHKLPEHLENLLKQLNSHCPDKEFIKELKLELMKNLHDRLKELTDSAQEIINSDGIIQRQLNSLRGVEFSCQHLKLISMGDTFSDKFLKISARKLMNDLFHALKRTAINTFTTVNPPPEVKFYGNQLMKLCFLIDDLTEDVCKYILNEDELLINGSGDDNATIKHGEHFFNMFKRAILKQCNSSFLNKFCKILFKEMIASNCYYIIKILIEISDYMYKYKNYDKDGLRSLVNIVSMDLNIILKFFMEPAKDVLFIELMSTLALASPDPLTEFKKKAPILEEWIIFRLKYEKNSLEQKSRVITLLPLLIGADDIKCEEIMEALKEVQRQHFPLRSQEFKKNSLQETGLKTAFTALLGALIYSKSFIVLEFIIKSTAQDPNHILEWLIKDELKIFMNNINEEQQVNCLMNVLEIACNEKIEPSIRQTILERFLLILIQSTNDEALSQFYVNKIKYINELTEKNYGFANSGWNVEHALMSRIIGYNLLEMMSGCLPKDKLLGKDSPIGIALFGEMKTTNELVGTFTKKSFYTRTEVFVTNDKIAAEYFRIYQCAAYRTVCSLVSNTQDKLQFYTKLIFIENESKNEYIWRKLIDCNDDKKYLVNGQEFEENPRIKERFVSIRKLNPRPMVNAEQYLTSSRILQTQNVFNSSLSQDVSNIDLNYTNVRNDLEVQLIKEKRSREIFSVQLERHDLNKHDIMACLCGVIQHMYENSITPKSDDFSNQRKPEWVIVIANAITNPENHRNIRLFLVQLIDNCRNVFQYYSSIVVLPILEVLSDESGRSELNFLITDLISLLLTWTSKQIYKPTTPEEIRLSSIVLKNVMQNAWNENEKIFKFNLELIKTMISLWKDFLIIPYQLLFDMITKTNRLDSRSNQCGIILVAIILSYDLNPWTESIKKNFIQAIFNNLNNQFASIYQPAAQVMGLILNKLKLTIDLINLEYFQSELISKLRSFRSKKEKLFMDILYGVQKNFPDILNNFQETISFHIPGSIGPIKRAYLEMFLNCLEGYTDTGIYNVMISIGLKDLLKNVEYELLALHIVNRGLPKMEEKDIENLFPSLEVCLESKKSECRDVVYEILIFIHLNFTSTLSRNAGKLLLKGLMDSDVQIQNRIYRFWSEEADLSNNTTDRIISLIADYSMNCEKQFLGFCTQLILDPAIKNPESKNQIFPYETDRDSKLMEYNVNTNYKIKSSYSLPPMFAESQQQRQSLLTVAAGSQLTNFIRETVGEYNFEPTQDLAKITQTRRSFSLPTQSCLPFDIQPQILDRRSQKRDQQQRFDEIASNTTAEDVNKSMENLRRRFLRDNKEKEERERVLRIIDVKTRQRERMVSEIRKKEGQVILYRRYRFGDFPDLIINHLAILLPLQGLVKRDPILAREIFVSIFKSLINDLGFEAQGFINSVANKIQTILENCKTCDPTMFAAFLEIALMKSQHFDFNPQTIALLSKATKMLTIGALYIENRLDTSEWDSVSERSTSTTTIDEKHWLNLAEIYNSLADYDIVSSIFSDKLKSDPRLAEGIELKAIGKYKEAQKCLLEAIKSHSVGTDYAYNCYYDCIIEMADWNCLSQEVQSQLDSFEDLWIDEFNTNYLLPKLIQGELHLILERENRSKDFLLIMESWMKDPIRSEYIKSTFCEELMMFSIADKEFYQSRVFGENYMKIFLADWGVINTLYDKLRLENLLNAQKVAEIDYYSLILLENFKEESIEKLRNRWSNCSIGQSESLRFWNCVISYRTFIASIIIDAIESLSQDNLSDRLRNCLFTMDLQLFNAAVYQKNVGIADKILKRLSPLNDHRYEIAKIKRTILAGDKSDGLNSINFIEQAWIDCKHLWEEQIPHVDRVDFKMEILNLNAQITEELFTKTTELNLDIRKQQQLMRLATNSQSENIHQCLFEQSLWALEESANLADTILNDIDLNAQNSKIVADSYYRLAQFCYNYQNHEKLEKSQETEKLLLKSVFQAMKYGSIEARQLFPCLLQLESVENGDLHEYFNEFAAEVPEWMFLMWIPQILSRLNYEQSSYLDNILLRIARIYPNALKYPFTVWYDRFKTVDSSDQVMVREGLGKIIDLLKNPIMDKFIKNLKALTLPEQLLTSNLEILLRYLQTTENITQIDYENHVQFLIDEVFQDDDCIQGSRFYKIKNYRKFFEDIKETTNIETQKDHIYHKLQNFNSTLRERTKSLKKEDLQMISLEELCPWLAHFQWCGEENFLELPGQYTGRKRPNIQDHIKIIKFGQRIEIFQSLRFPIKITMYGSDGKTYDFLVKFGEDLKQDQRIQQLFEIMSEKLAEDEKCRNHNLFIRTFRVIPIEERGGMISWVSNTMELEKFIVNCMKRRSPNEHALAKIYQQYTQFIKKPSKDLTRANDPIYYGTAAASYSIDELIANFRNMETGVDLKILQYALFDICVSAESYFVLRNNFATSLAAMNVAHWILGIGDRHLLNILISTKDASLTGIDFGYVFGASVRDLPIPEMIPFRLTPHFVYVMNPMGTSGILYKCMVHVLRVLRESKGILMTCMEVFIREPTINWLNLPKRERFGADNDDEHDSSSVSSNWEPKDRINVVRCKLEGYNPLNLLEYELKNGSIAKNADFLKGYLKILRGRQQFNIRARLPETGLTVDEQVKCLIDLATDPGILGITFHGFMPWM